MKQKEFEKRLFRRIAQVSVGASAIRNQGGAGLIEILRDYFEDEINPRIFFSILPKNQAFRNFLDDHTKKVLKRFPRGAKSWGAARKGLNLFFRDLVYNGYYANKYGVPDDYSALNNFMQNLEVPLDKEVAQGIIADAEEKIPRWTNIKNLTPEISDIYQHQAQMIANNRGTARINLDLIYWRSNET